jgi:putative tryptophan/tyrosine transport system substrate-binding protein
MKKVFIQFALCAMLLAFCPHARAQQAKKIPRVGVLSPASEPSTMGFETFRQALRDLGYVEGKTIAIEYRLSQGKLERLPDLASELVRLKVDVIVTSGTAAARAAKQATSTTPIVMGAGGDPVASGLVTSLARPGGNITGLSLQSPELHGKRLELLKETFPTVSYVAVIRNAANPGSVHSLGETEAVAKSLGVKLKPVEVRGPDEFDRAFRAITTDRPDALITLSDSTLWNYRIRIVDFAVKSRLPAMFPEKEYVDDGGLMSYAPSVPDNFRRAATYVDKILKGAKPADLPVEQPKKFELVINLKTAKQIGLTVPPNVLARADRVIR